MLILEPQIIFKENNLINRLFQSKNLIITKNPLLKKQVDQSFIQKRNIEQIIKSTKKSIEFLNQLYAHRWNNPLPLQILELPEITKYGIQDLGGIYDYKESIHGSNGIIKMEIDLLTVQKRWEKESFAIILNRKLKLDKFTQFVTFHEAGHYIDYLDRNIILQSKNRDNIVWNNFLKNNTFEKYLRYWEGTDIDINEHLKRNFQENIADCFGAILLSISSKKDLKNIVNIINEARLDSHNGNPTEIYSTFNSLDRLLFNVKNMPLNTAQNIIDLVQKSAQEGFIMNLKEIFEGSKHHELSNVIKNDNHDINFEEQVLQTAKALKI